MLPGAPPFSESETVTRARTVAGRLAMSQLPILIEGEVGTGRRTLATALARLRSKEKQEVLVFSAFDGVPEVLRRDRAAAVVVLHHLHALDHRGQAEVAALVRERRIELIATTKANDCALSPELSALVDATRVALPPLRERASDVLPWADYFLKKSASELGAPAPSLTAGGRESVLTHRWPGNLSELESVIGRAVLLRPSASDPLDTAALGFAESLLVQPLNEAVERFRMGYVAQVLAHFGGNRTQAAKALGIDPRTIFRYLAKTKDEGA